MFLTILLGFSTFLLILDCFIRYGKVGKISNHIPGLKAYPIIGNLYYFQLDLGKNNWKPNLSKILEHEFRVISNPQSMILLKSTQHLEKTIPSYNLNFFQLKFLQLWLSTGLVTSAGKKWQHQRKMLTPTFHFNILKHFVVNFKEETQYLVTLLKEEGKGGPIIKDLQEFLPVHTLNAICETAMGTSLRGTGEFEAKYRNAVHDFGKIVVYRLARPWYFFDTIFALSQRGRQQKELLKTLHGFSKKIIAERILFHEQTKGKYLQNVEEVDENQIFSKETDEKNKNPIFKKRLALLNLLIAASLNDNQIDEEGIREEVDAFMFAGHDTTAMAMCFGLLLFAKHSHLY
ncbi:cytochrome P450 4C1-like [Vespa velutina]|uniref:cytochrome P450 4C1-like n=1 Tax=Vespa velutina TaxID=202808 RepID=UPI001FB30660|nr:cytochrome P450 4C1-like [Vespa velutina]